MNDQSEIIKVWEIEQEILDVFHEFCVKHSLNYSLAYGTLLGAIRHQGFIPWDDDIDVMMPRKDYNLFLELWLKEMPSGYILQNYELEDDYTNNFAKIRKQHTTFLQSDDEKEKKYHKGIFIDIFPIDRVAPTTLKRKYQYCMCAMNLLYTKRFKSGHAGVLGIIESILLRLGKNHYKELYHWTKKQITHWNDNTNDLLFSFCTIESCKNYYPDNMFDHIIEVDFNNKTYYSIKDYDQVLKIDYGNYMKLPPEEERVWKHHPLIIDFTKDYEEIDE